MGRRSRKRGCSITTRSKATDIVEEPAEVIKEKLTDERMLMVFGNSLIVAEILRGLGLRDILSLSETNSAICKVIRINPAFSSRLHLCLGKHKNKARLPLLFGLPIVWKHASLEVNGWNAGELEEIQRILSSVISLSLHVKMTSKKQEPIPTEEIAKIVLAIPRLKSLTFGADLLSSNLTPFFTTEMQSHLQNLNELKLVGTMGTGETAPVKIKSYYHDFNELEAGDQQRIQNFNTNIQVLILGIPSGLSSLTIINIRTKEMGLKTLLADLVLGRKESLVHLHLDAETLPLVTKETFPKLMHFRADFNEEDCNAVANFVKNHQTLKSISLDNSRTGSWTIEFPQPTRWTGGGEALLDAIAATTINSELVDLDLVFRRRDFEPDEESVPTTLEFLRDFNQLERVGIKFNWNEVDDGDVYEVYHGGCRASRPSIYQTAVNIRNILEHVPSNIKDIRISGVPMFYYEKKSLQLQTRNRFHQLIPKFTSLHSLDLFNCPGTFVDETLQALLPNLTNLRLFAFSHCDKLTNMGITGRKKRGRDIGIGLNSLTKLEELKIGNCPRISTSAYVESISFPLLRKLTLSTENERPSWDQFFTLIQQNPSLELFSHDESHNDIQDLNIYINSKLSDIGRLPILIRTNI